MWRREGPGVKGSRRRGDIGVAQKPKETRPEHTGVGVGHASPLGGQAPCSELLEIRNATHRSAVQGQATAQKKRTQSWEQEGGGANVAPWGPASGTVEGPSGTPHVCCPIPHLWGGRSYLGTQRASSDDGEDTQPLAEKQANAEPGLGPWGWLGVGVICSAVLARCGPWATSVTECGLWGGGHMHGDAAFHYKPHTSLQLFELCTYYFHKE